MKGLLLEILRLTDEILNTKYYENALRARATTDMLIGSVSQAALHHIGLLVIDEIQNVVGNKNGQSLVGMLTQLINNSGIGICMVGTPKCKLFFEKEMQLARRSLGLEYGAMAYDDSFYELCKTLFRFQYTKNRVSFTDEIVRWLYEHSGGIVSVVVSLIHDAQEIAILDHTEELNIRSPNLAYTKRLSLLHEYISDVPTPSLSRRKEKFVVSKDKKVIPGIRIASLIDQIKTSDMDLVEVLKENFVVSEVSIC